MKLIHLINFKRLTLSVTVISLIGILASLISQYWFGMNPCVMCILQRLALVGVFIASFLAYLLPGSRQLWTRIVAACLISAPALYGLSVAIEQILLQAMPADQQPSCGAPWTFRLRDMPLFNWYEWLIRGTGNCGKIHTVFGINLAIWSILFFSIILLTVWIGCFKSKR